MNVLRGKESRRRMVSESGLLYDLLGYDTADSQVDLHRLADRGNNVPGSSCPAFSAPAFRFPLSPALRIHHDFARPQPAGSGIEPPCAVLQAKSSVHGVEHRTQCEMDGSALRFKLHRTLPVSR